MLNLHARGARIDAVWGVTAQVRNVRVEVVDVEKERRSAGRRGVATRPSFGQPRRHPVGDGIGAGVTTPGGHARSPSPESIDPGYARSVRQSARPCRTSRLPKYSSSPPRPRSQHDDGPIVQRSPPVRGRLAEDGIGETDQTMFLSAPPHGGRMRALRFLSAPPHGGRRPMQPKPVLSITFLSAPPLGDDIRMLRVTLSAERLTVPISRAREEASGADSKAPTVATLRPHHLRYPQDRSDRTRANAVPGGHRTSAVSRALHGPLVPTCHPSSNAAHRDHAMLPAYALATVAELTPYAPAIHDSTSSAWPSSSTIAGCPTLRGVCGLSPGHRCPHRRHR